MCTETVKLHFPRLRRGARQFRNEEVLIVLAVVAAFCLVSLPIRFLACLAAVVDALAPRAPSRGSACATCATGFCNERFRVRIWKRGAVACKIVNPTSNFVQKGVAPRHILQTEYNHSTIVKGLSLANVKVDIVVHCLCGCTA
jgi:hypothetical protein